MKPILIMAAVPAALALGACSKNPLKGKDAALLDASPGINTERLAARNMAWDEGRWVREGLLAHAEKKRSRQMAAE